MLGVVRFPLAWFAAKPLGATGDWLAFAVSNVVGAVIADAWYQRGTWRGSEPSEANVNLDETAVEPTADRN